MSEENEWLALCRKRAIELLDLGSPVEALNSLISDLSKNAATSTRLNIPMMDIGIQLAIADDGPGLRSWIEDATQVTAP